MDSNVVILKTNEKRTECFIFRAFPCVSAVSGPLFYLPKTAIYCLRVSHPVSHPNPLTAISITSERLIPSSAAVRLTFSMVASFSEYVTTFLLSSSVTSPKILS